MWQFIHYATQGRSHIKSNIPCQDKTYVLQKHNVSVIALSDGAGSARLSHFGAQESVCFVANNIAKSFDDYFGVEGAKDRILAKLQKRLELIAKKRKCSVSELACTLLCVAIKGDKFIMLHIGDGVIGCLKGDSLKVLSSPNNGEFANTTSFVTSKNTMNSMRFVCGSADKINGFVLMSDGAQASLYSKADNALAPVLRNIMQSDLALGRLQIGLQNSFEKTIKNATSDDCSIAFAIRRDARGYDVQNYFSYLAKGRASISIGAMKKSSAVSIRKS